VCELMTEMDEDWRKKNVDPRIQCWLNQRLPRGYGILYVGVNTLDHFKAYIGKCADTKRSPWSSRIFQHRKGKTEGELQKNKKQTHVHNAIVKYGVDAFVWFVLDMVKVENINTAEVDAIARFGTLEWGYNEQPGGEGGMTPEALQKMTATKRTPENRAASSAIMKGCLKHETVDHKAQRLACGSHGKGSCRAAPVCGQVCRSHPGEVLCSSRRDDWSL
jgi:hypothetical protein